jgi:anti-sigma-K factor RskA
MSDDPTITGENGQSLAAEYVLGVLDADARREAELKLARDSVFAAEVAFWEQRLGGLANEVHAVAPPAHVWSRIDAALSPELKSGNFWSSLLFWRWTAFASAALAAACLAVVYVAAVAPARAPLVAKLDANGQTGFLATLESGGNTITIVPASATTVDQRALELWLIPPGEQPRSLGLIDAGRPIRISIPAGLAGRATSNATLAVSVEPPGGSPTGLPTGPVIASGKLTNL